jgi:hypothetical protein
MKFKENISLYIIVLFTILFLASSFFRFVVTNDYVVAYEISCEPTTNDCFVGCEDEECTAQYYFAEIRKNAGNLQRQCGNDITDCESAHQCLPYEISTCSIIYCDLTTDGEDCETLVEESLPELNELDEKIQEEEVITFES